jgi:antitoxin YefM
MKMISFADARRDLNEVIDRVVEFDDVTFISRGDVPNAVIMSIDHCSSLMETVHLGKR